MPSELKLFVLILALVFVVPGRATAQERRWSMGVRRGFSATSYDDPFAQTELFGTFDLPSHRPWRFNSESGWFMQSRLIGSVGGLRGQHEAGFVGSLGFSLIFGQEDFPLYIDTGTSPTILSRDEFGPVNFGIPLQFTSYGGIYFRHRNVSVGYRFQHMSNASLSDHNPGLDLHMLGVAYHF